MNEQELAKEIIAAEDAGGGMVHVPAGTYQMAVLNRWLLRYRLPNVRHRWLAQRLLSAVRLSPTVQMRGETYP